MDDDEYYSDWDEEIDWFHDKIQSLYNTEDAQWSHKCDNDCAGSGVGAGDTGAADCAELRAHGDEVKPEVIVDDKGGIWKAFSKVIALFYSLYAVLTLDLQMSPHIFTVSTVEPEQGTDCEESSRGLERASDPQIS